MNICFRIKNRSNQVYTHVHGDEEGGGGTAGGNIRRLNLWASNVVGKEGQADPQLTQQTL
jgi:hypothetical protein